MGQAIIVASLAVSWHSKTYVFILRAKWN